MHDQKTRDEYHKWDKEFCTDAAPTYWECWQAACDSMHGRLINLESDFNAALIERNNAEKREYEALGRANALDAELKATQARLDASDDLLREEFAQRQDALRAELGDWQLKHDLRLRMGITSFGLSAGATVAVTQLDREFGKVLVDVGPAMCDWMSESWLLEHFVRCED